MTNRPRAFPGAVSLGGGGPRHPAQASQSKIHKSGIRFVDTTGRVGFHHRLTVEEQIMSVRTRFLAMALLVAVGSMSQTGCFSIRRPGAESRARWRSRFRCRPTYRSQKEDQFWNYERYERAQVLGPLAARRPLRGPRRSPATTR